MSSHIEDINFGVRAFRHFDATHRSYPTDAQLLSRPFQNLKLIHMLCVQSCIIRI